MSNDQFVSLHNHCSEGSMLDALQSSKQLIDRAALLGHSAVALTDHGAINAVYSAYKYSKTTNVKLICGNEFYFRHDINDETERGNKHLVLIATNATGWSNILKLNYLGWQKQRTIFMKQYPIITWDDLESNRCEGIIALTACSSGILSRHIMNDDEEKTHCHVKKLHNIFGDNLFLEVQPHNLKTENGKVDQVRVNTNLIKLAREYNIKLVATNDAHYLKGDAQYHDVLLAIKDKKPISDPDRHKYSVDEFYLKPGTDIIKFFGPELGNELILNTQLISQRCDIASYLEPSGAKLPEFPVSDAHDYAEFKTWKERNISNKNINDSSAYLRYKTAIGFQSIYEHLDPEQVDEYYQRIKSELGVIESKGFSSYMLMVADFIEEAKRQDILTGYGRGSAAGSLVSYLTGITKVDPIKHKLLFERFLNKYKTAYPDIDCDYAVPEKIVEYAKKKYGEKRVAQVSNIMRMKPKVVVKDVARSLELGAKEGQEQDEIRSNAFKLANDITKVMPDAKTIEEAMGMSKDFSVFMNKYPSLLENCKRLQNIERQSGVHAAAIVVSNEDLDGIAPLRCDKENHLVLAYDKDIAEEVGFVKFDFLGVITLAVVAETLKLIEKRTGKKISIDDIKDGDKNVYKMISNGDTKCVFQLEASLTPLCKAIKPKNIDDLAIITTIGRPGVPAEERQEYIDRRFGRKPIKLLHPKMASSTKDTFGILVFEEQLMFLAQDIAGWDFYKSDSLRKITKLKDKGIELQEKTGKEFIADAIKNGIEPDRAVAVWDRVVQFGKYSFNASHAVSYSYLSYLTAYLKYYYPTEFMCAIINFEDPNSDKLQEYKQLAKEMGIEIVPPSINTSDLKYKIISDKQIMTGLLAIKGIGDAAIQYLINNRPYNNFPQFIFKSTGTKGNRSPITKTVIESLAKAGCFDALNITRKNSLEHWQDIKTKIVSVVKKAAKNNAVINLDNVMENIIIDDEFDKKKILQNEMEVIGHYLTGTHNDVYGGFFKNSPDIISFADINDMPAGQTVKIEAIIKLKSKEIKIKSKGKNLGKLFAKYLLEDILGKTAEITIWPDQYSKFRSILIDGIPIRAYCEINEYLDTKSLVLKKIEDIPGAITNGIINKTI